MSRSGFIFFLNALAILREKDVIIAKVPHFDFNPCVDVILFLGFGFDLQHLRGKDRGQSSMMTSIPQIFLLVIIPFCQ
jgi:hypothetical protein